jgi:hypothetical protein
VSVDQLLTIRDRFLPMARYIGQEYQFRVPAGYPIIHDDVNRGITGIELDPSHSLYLTSDGDALYAEMTYRSSRFDTRSSAGREKFGGRPVVDRRPLAVDITDQALRNLLSELMSRWNSQQTLIHITDS